MRYIYFMHVLNVLNDDVVAVQSTSDGSSLMADARLLFLSIIHFHDHEILDRYDQNQEIRPPESIYSDIRKETEKENGI